MKRSLSSLLLGPALIVALIAIAYSPALAGWPDDPTVNLAIADGPGEQVLPKIALTSDGGCYVGWFGNQDGSYRVYLQRLDRLGNELWPHNGILISDNPQSTSLVDWDLDTDTEDHAVLVFTDTRGGSDLDVYAYRISPDGDFVWGADGLTLSDNDDWEPTPQCAALLDGNTVFVWARYPDSGAGGVLIQKISPDGTLLFDPPVVVPGDSASERPAFADVVPADTDGFIVSWLRDTATFPSPRHLRAQKFASDGTPQWGSYVSVYDTWSLPLGYHPRALPDDAGGAVLYWHVSTGSLYDSYVQHLTSDGTELFGDNGMEVSTQSGIFIIEPTASYRAESQEIFVFFQTRNTSQSNWGLNAQKITAGGTRAWTDNGVLLHPMDSTYEGQPRAAVVGDGAVVTYFDEPTGSITLDRVMAMRVDTAGNILWGDTAVEVASTLSGKARLPIAAREDGVVLACWEDNRAGTVDLYGQSLNPDGTVGNDPASVESPPFDRISNLSLRSSPNPFYAGTTITIGSGTLDAAQSIIVCDGSGRIVRRLVASARGTSAASVAWDGRDEEGRTCANGIYLLRSAGGGTTGNGKAILIRR